MRVQGKAVGTPPGAVRVHPSGESAGQQCCAWHGRGLQNGRVLPEYASG